MLPAPRGHPSFLRPANGRLPSRTLRPVVRRVLLVTRAAVRVANDGALRARPGLCDRVRSLRFDGSRATALVDGSDVYEVALDCAAAPFDGACTCLDAVELDEFCKTWWL